MVLTIEHASVESDETRRLMAELCAEIDQLYGNDIHPASNLSRMDHRARRSSSRDKAALPSVAPRSAR